jgi:hypothetical protein
MPDLARQFSGEDAAEWRRHMATAVANLRRWLADDAPVVPTDPRFQTYATDRDFYRAYFTSIAKNLVGK